MKDIVRYTLMLLIAVLAQVVIFNRLCLFGVAIPLVFIYFIIKLPVTLGAKWTMTLAFLAGLVVDIFSDTLGINALACTCAGALRMPVFHLYYPRDEDMMNPEPSIRSMGVGAYLKYVLTFTAVYCTLFVVIESFSFVPLGWLLLKIVSSTLFTFVLLVIADSIFSRR